MEARLMWKFVESSKSRTVRFKKWNEQYGSMEKPETREDLLKQLPEGPEGNELKHSIFGRSNYLASEQDDQLAKFQVDNAFMISRIAVLKKKLAAERINCKRQSWVESILQHMDEVTMDALKTKFKKKVGVSDI